MGKVKETLLELAAKLPDNCTWDEVLYRIYVQKKIEQGLADIAEGREHDHDDVFKELEKW